MILQFESGSTIKNGTEQGTVFVNMRGKPTARIRRRPANKTQRQRYVPPWRMTSARAAFAALASSVKEDWNDWAANHTCWPIQGTPRSVSGAVFFENAYVISNLWDSSAGVPTVPTSEPAWQDRPQFSEFATWVNGKYTIAAATDMDSGTKILASGLPPTKSGFKPQFNLEAILGGHEFVTGLSIDDETDFIHDLMEDKFGTIDSTQKIWGRLWEVSADEKQIRVIKDPCTPDPTSTPATDAIDIEWYNDASAVCEGAYIMMFNDDWEIVGESEVDAIDAYSYGYSEMELSETWSSDQSWQGYWSAQWDDGWNNSGAEDYEGETDWFVGLYY